MEVVPGSNDDFRGAEQQRASRANCEAAARGGVLQSDSTNYFCELGFGVVLDT
jgi:hypothetical protein